LFYVFCYLTVGFDELPEGAVPGPLNVIREDAGREFSPGEVIFKALATDAVAWTAAVAAVAALDVGFLLALHGE